MFPKLFTKRKSVHVGGVLVYWCHKNNNYYSSSSSPAIKASVNFTEILMTDYYFYPKKKYNVWSTENHDRVSQSVMFGNDKQTNESKKQKGLLLLLLLWFLKLNEE